MSPLVGVRPPVQRRNHQVSALIAVVAFAVGTMLLLNDVVFSDPSFVDTVRIDNPTDYNIHVEIGTPESGSRLPLGAVVQRCVTEFHTVLDQGDTWMVSLRTQGRDAGELTVARDDIARDGWTIHIPASMSDRLHAGTVPTPPDYPCPASSPSG
jgi:hypothetical protein